MTLTTVKIVWALVITLCVFMFVGIMVAVGP